MNHRCKIFLKSIYLKQNPEKYCLTIFTQYYSILKSSEVSLIIQRENNLLRRLDSFQNLKSNEHQKFKMTYN